MQNHIKTLGWLQIAIHGINILIGLAILFGSSLFGMAAGLAAVPVLGLLFGALGWLIAGLFIVIGLPGTIIGWYIIQRKPWARIAGIVLCVIDLFFAHTLGISQIAGIYGLWVLFNSETIRIFDTEVRGY